MTVTVVNEDKVVVADGEGLNFDFVLNDNIWSIQWNGTSGHIEYKDETPSETITSFSDYQYLVDGHTAEKQRIADAETQAEADRVASLTYADKREAEYPSGADYLDGIVKGDQAQIDKYIADCQAVKDKYPKE
jgi:hypothetical protein